MSRDLGWSNGSLLEQPLVTGHVVLRTHSGTFGHSPHLVEWPFYYYLCKGVQCVLEEVE
jgi:hypothetical protein